MNALTKRPIATDSESGSRPRETELQMSKNVIEIKIGDVEVRCSSEGNDAESTLEGVLRALKRHVPEQLASNGSESGNGREAPPSPEHLLRMSSASTFGEKAGIVAFWLQHHGGRSRWRSGEIVEVLRDAGEAVPTNITDALNQKLKKGLFEVKDRMWCLTGEGIGWVRYSLLTPED